MVEDISNLDFNQPERLNLTFAGFMPAPQQSHFEETKLCSRKKKQNRSVSFINSREVSKQIKRQKVKYMPTQTRFLKTSLKAFPMPVRKQTEKVIRKTQYVIKRITLGGGASPYEENLPKSYRKTMKAIKDKEEKKKSPQK